MKVAFDYWQVLSHYPKQIDVLMTALKSSGHEIHVISAIGKNRIGTIVNDVHQHIPWLSDSFIHEVVFDRPRQSPEKKLEKCRELGIEIFFDDRDDVCCLLNENGIMSMRVLRKDSMLRDINAERPQ